MSMGLRISALGKQELKNIFLVFVQNLMEQVINIVARDDTKVNPLTFYESCKLYGLL
jgi:hypothetical protein